MNAKIQLLALVLIASSYAKADLPTKCVVEVPDTRIEITLNKDGSGTHKWVSSVGSSGRWDLTKVDIKESLIQKADFMAKPLVKGTTLPLELKSMTYAVSYSFENPEHDGSLYSVIQVFNAAGVVIDQFFDVEFNKNPLMLVRCK